MIPRAVLLSGVALVTLAACDTARRADVATAYRDAPRLELRETQRFCTDDVMTVCQLGPSAFANPTPDGGVILGVPAGPVARFDPAGTLIAEYGRQGGGPGEYRRLHGAYVLEDGSVVLQDRVSHRLLFAADGTPIATHIEVLEDQGQGIRDLRLVSDGFAFLDDPPADVGDSVLSEVRLLRDTLPPVLVARVPLIRLNNAMGVSQPPAFFEDRPHWAVESDTSALVASGPTLSVRRYFGDGRAVDVVHSAEVGDREVTPADIRAERDRRMPKGDIPIPPQMLQPMISSVDRAEAGAATVHPFAADLRVLQDGAFLLRESLVQADSVRWTLFQQDGVILGQFRLSKDTQVAGGRRDRLLLIMPGDYDVPVVGWFSVLGGQD